MIMMVFLYPYKKCFVGYIRINLTIVCLSVFLVCPTSPDEVSLLNLITVYNLKMCMKENNPDL